MRTISCSRLVPGMYVEAVDAVPGFPFKPGRIHREMIDWMVRRGLKYALVAEDHELGTDEFSRESERARLLVSQAHRQVTDALNSVARSRPPDPRLMENLCTPLLNELVLHRDLMLLALSLKNKDQYTYEHSVRVGAYAMLLAAQVDIPLEDRPEFGMAGFLHDVGKLLVPSEIIQKPGKLTAEEFALIRAHPAEGGRLLSSHGNVSPEVVRAVREHHERMDGRGYVGGLAGEEISTMGKILGVVDTYDAITSDRPYKAGKSSYAALAEMRTLFLHAYDVELLDHFIKAVGIYAPGTLVRLTDGRYATVVGNNADNLLKPWVVVYEAVESPGGEVRYRRGPFLNLDEGAVGIEAVMEPAGEEFRTVTARIRTPL